MATVKRHKASKNALFTFCFALFLTVVPFSTIQALTLKIATVSPDGTMWMSKMRAGAAEISTKTQGRVKFKFYPGGVMGNSQSVLRKMRFGQLHGGVFTAGNLMEVYPDIQIYALPFLFSSQQEVDFIRQRMDSLLLEGLERKGYIAFGLAGAGFAYTMSATLLKTIDDFRQHKVWVPAGDRISLLVMKAAGVVPVPLPLSDVLTGLQTGMIDTVAVSPVGAIAFQWHTTLTYFSEEPISYIYGLLAIDKKAFNKITPLDQNVVRDVMSRTYREIDRQNRLDNLKAKQALQQQGLKFVHFPPELLAKWQTYAKKTITQLGNQGAYTPEMFKTLQENLRLYKQSN